LNIRSTKKFFEENNVVALKADKNVSPEVNELLKELGNSSTAIPYYAIYSPGMKEPIHFGGNFLTGGTVRDVLQQALDANEATANASSPPAATETDAKAANSRTELDWRAFSKDIIEDVVNNGEIAFVDFSAPWCAPCLRDKKLALDVQATKEFFDANKIVPIYANIDESENATKLLENIKGEARIPHYAIYHPGAKEPLHFSGPLTPDSVKQKIQEAIESASPRVSSR